MRHTLSLIINGGIIAYLDIWSRQCYDRRVRHSPILAAIIGSSDVRTPEDALASVGLTCEGAIAFVVTLFAVELIVNHCKPRM